MDELRKCWKVPYIVYYCNLFVETFDLVDLRIDEFEEALLDDNGTDTNLIIVHLLQKILKPFLIRTIDLTTFESVLLTVLKRFKKQDLFVNRKWNELNLKEKIDILYELCDLRLQLSDVESKFNELEVDSIRLTPLGIDSSNNKLWYFSDLRLYEEKAHVVKEKPITLEIEQVSTRAYRKNKYRRPPIVQPTQTEAQEPIEYESIDDIQWSCICVTLEDWQNLAIKYKKSRKKVDQELYTELKTNYLNILPELFERDEKERRQRELACSLLVTKRFESSTQQASTSSTTTSTQEDLVVDEISEDSHTHLSSQLSMCQTSTVTLDFNVRNYFLMHKVMNKLLKSKYAWPFKQPVSDADAPDYVRIVKNPIDLSIVQLKINKKVYKSREEFIQDLNLLVANCKLYNGADSYYGKIASKLEDLFNRFLKTFYNQEISNSLEEKNRLLKKLNNTNNDDINNNDDSLENYNNDETTLLGTASEANTSQLQDERVREYVTKTTSRGRIVRVRVNQEFTYDESDEQEDECQDGEEEKRKRGRPRKLKNDEQFNHDETSDDSSDNDENIELRKIKKRVLLKSDLNESKRRGRGRPRKYPRNDTNKNDNDMSLTSSSVSFDNKNIQFFDSHKNIRVPMLNPALKVVLAQNKVKISQYKPALASSDVNNDDDSLFNLSNLESLNNSIKMIALPSSSHSNSPQILTSQIAQSRPNIIKIVNLSELKQQQQQSQQQISGVSHSSTVIKPIFLMNNSMSTPIRPQIYQLQNFSKPIAPVAYVPNKVPTENNQQMSILSKIIFNTNQDKSGNF